MRHPSSEAAGRCFNSRPAANPAPVSLVGGALLASTPLPRARAAADIAKPGVPASHGAWVRIEPDNTLVIPAHGCEIGQGVMASRRERPTARTS